jgi:hypothetical protein
MHRSFRLTSDRVPDAAERTKRLVAVVGLLIAASLLAGTPAFAAKSSGKPGQRHLEVKGPRGAVVRPVDCDAGAVELRSSGLRVALQPRDRIALRGPGRVVVDR